MREAVCTQTVSAPDRSPGMAEAENHPARDAATTAAARTAALKDLSKLTQLLYRGAPWAPSRSNTSKPSGLTSTSSPPPEPYVFAYRSLARTALVGAASAAWVLAPDDRAERIERSRNITTCSQYEQDAGTDAVAEHVAMRQRELSEKCKADGDRARYETTRIIRQAALDTFVPKRMAEKVAVEWRSGSCPAHGLLHALSGVRG